MRVLIVETDATRAKMVEMFLSAAGFNPYVCGSTEEAYELADLYDYDIMLLTMSVYGANALIGRMRSNRIDLPILCFEAHSDPEKIASLLTNGADDVMGIPFHRVELCARLTAIVRRSKGHAAATISTGPVVVDLDSKTVAVNGQPVHLTGKEYGMMELLALRKGSTLTKEAFLNHLYGGMDEPDLKVIDVFICKLRKKLTDAGAGGLIHTVWGRGFRLDEPSDATKMQSLVDADA